MAICILALALILITGVKGGTITEIKTSVSGGRMDSELITILNSPIKTDGLTRTDLSENPFLNKLTVLEAIKLVEKPESTLEKKIERQLLSTLRELKTIYSDKNGYAGFKLKAFYPSGKERDFTGSLSGSISPTKAKKTSELKILHKEKELKITFEVGI